MIQTEMKPKVFVSGERVPPGVYRDTMSGMTVRVYEEDELPDEVRLVRSLRLFVRLDDNQAKPLPALKLADG